MPTSLASLILSQIDQLNERQKTTLKVASIVGRTFRATWLWGFYPPLGEPGEVRNHLEELHALELTALDQPEPITTYLFKHILTHGVAYDSLPFETRAWLHGQLALYIEHSYSDTLDQFVDLLAYHYDLSPNLAKRREYLQRAGEAAQAAYANAAAIGYYRRVLALIPEPEQGPVRFRLGQVLEMVGEWAEADQEYRRALELAEQADAPALAETSCYAIGSLNRKQGQYTVALEWLERARGAAQERSHTAAVVQAIVEMGEVFRFQGDFAAARLRYDESLSLSAAADHDTALQAARASALKGAGTLAAQQGDLETARRLYDESLALLRTLGDRPGIAALLNNMSIVARFQGDLAESRRLNEESLLQFRQIGDRWRVAQSLNNLGNVARDSSDYEYARRVLEESLKLSRRLGSRWGIANTLSSLTNLLLRIGERDEVGILLDESLALNRELGDRNAIAYCLEDYAGLAAGEGQAERSLRLAGAAAALRESIGAPLPPAEQSALDALLAPARALLDTTQATVAWEHGRAMSFDDAIALASIT